ncbi:hypothetical protein LINPERHAP1_LOCUS36820, partial [Linum perenne]
KGYNQGNQGGFQGYKGYNQGNQWTQGGNQNQGNQWNQGGNQSQSNQGGEQGSNPPGMYNHKGNGPPGFNKPPQNKEGGSSTSQEDTNAAIFQLFKNQQASISNLTTQLGHVAKALSERPKGSLPANTEVNPKGPEELMMVTLRSGKQFQDATPKVL